MPTNVKDLTVTVTIPLDAYMGGGTEWSGDPDEGPVERSSTVIDSVINAVAHQLKEDLMREFNSRTGSRYYGYDVSSLYDAKLKEKVEKLVEERVNEKLAANWFGTDKTIEQAITEKVDDWLKQLVSDGYGRSSQPRLEKMVNDVIGRDLQRAIDEAIKKARTDALDAIGKVAQDRMADALREQLAVVAQGGAR